MLTLLIIFFNNCTSDMYESKQWSGRNDIELKAGSLRFRSGSVWCCSGEGLMGCMAVEILGKFEESGR